MVYLQGVYDYLQDVRVCIYNERCVVCTVYVREFMVVLIRADCCVELFPRPPLKPRPSDGESPQRCNPGGVLEGVCDRSVCVELLVCSWTSTCMPLSTVRGCGRSSSLSDSQPRCTICVAVCGRHWIPWCTRSVRRDGVPPGGVSVVAKKGEVRLRTLMSQMARISFGGQYSLGGERSSGVSLHLSSAGGPSLSEEYSALYGGSLADSLFFLVRVQSVIDLCRFSVIPISAGPEVILRAPARLLIPFGLWSVSLSSVSVYAGFSRSIVTLTVLPRILILYHFSPLLRMS